MSISEYKDYLVYKHVNRLNGKTYVGITCQQPNCRWANGNAYKANVMFHADIVKYGWEDGFEHKILIHGLTLQQAWAWEKKLINVWKLLNPNNGYNLNSGGCSGKKMSEESRKKVSQNHADIRGEKNPFYGKFHTQETKNKISNSCKKNYKITGRKPWNKGKHLSKELRQKLSRIRREKIKNGEIKIWSKGKKCIQLSGVNHPMYGKHHSNETIQKIKNTLRGKMNGSKNPNAKKVVRLSDCKIYSFIQECATDNNMDPTTITTHCRNNLKNKKQEFMFYEDFIKTPGYNNLITKVVDK